MFLIIIIVIIIIISYNLCERTHNLTLPTVLSSSKTLSIECHSETSINCVFTFYCYFATLFLSLCVNLLWTCLLLLLFDLVFSIKPRDWQCKSQIGFTFLVPAHPDSPGQRVIKRLCVCSSAYDRRPNHHFNSKWASEWPLSLCLPLSALVPG